MNTIRLDYDKETGMLVRVVRDGSPLIEGTIPAFFVLDSLPFYVKQMIEDAERKCSTIN